MAGTEGVGNGGDISVNSNQFNISGVGASGIGAGLYEQVLANASGKSGNILIKTQLLKASSGANLVNDVRPRAMGNAGDLTINTNRLIVEDGSYVSSSTFGMGNAGNLTIYATELIQVTGTSPDGQTLSKIFTDVESEASGQGGSLKLDTPQLIVADGGQISSSTFGQGNAGSITINSDSIDIHGIGAGGIDAYPAGIFVEVVNSVTDKGVRGGDLTITTQSLSIRDGAKISGTTSGRGDTGNVTIYASGKVEVVGTRIVGPSPGVYFISKISTDVIDGAIGNSGNLTIEASRLVVKNGGEVSSSTFGMGNAGTLIVRASDSVELKGESPGTGERNGYPSGLFAQVEPTGEGSGGNLTIETGRLDVSNGSKVQTATFGRGNAGDLFIRASEVNVFETDTPGVFTAAINAGVSLGPSSFTVPRGNGGNLTIENQALQCQKRWGGYSWNFWRWQWRNIANHCK